MKVLVAHCQTNGCYMRVPVCALNSDATPEFDPTLRIVVVCPNCGKEFHEPAAELELAVQTDVTGKIRIARTRVSP